MLTRGGPLYPAQAPDLNQGLSVDETYGNLRDLRDMSGFRRISRVPIVSEWSRIQGEVYGYFEDYAMQRVTTPFSLL
jgi:hypothetical protein